MPPPLPLPSSLSSSPPNVSRPRPSGRHSTAATDRIKPHNTGLHRRLPARRRWRHYEVSGGRGPAQRIDKPEPEVVGRRTARCNRIRRLYISSTGRKTGRTCRVDTEFGGSAIAQRRLVDTGSNYSSYAHDCCWLCVANRFCWLQWLVSAAAHRRQIGHIMWRSGSSGICAELWPCERFVLGCMLSFTIMITVRFSVYL